MLCTLHSVLTTQSQIFCHHVLGPFTLYYPPTRHPSGMHHTFVCIYEFQFYVPCGSKIIWFLSPFNIFFILIFMPLQMRQREASKPTFILESNTGSLWRNQCILCHLVFCVICLWQVEMCSFCSLQECFGSKILCINSSHIYLRRRRRLGEIEES